MIIVVSDVHLGYEYCNAGDFLNFLDNCISHEIDHLILLGDVFEFWRRNNADIILDKVNTDIIARLGDPRIKKVHYVIGNHDYYMLNLYERRINEGQPFPFTISKSLRLTDGGKKFFFIHGYELEVLANLEPLTIEAYESLSERLCMAKDTLGGYITSLWNLWKNRSVFAAKIGYIEKPPAERKGISKADRLATSPGAYLFLGKMPDEILVYGHTHRPYVSEDGMVVNTGSWVSEKGKDRRFNTYLKIEDGRFELKDYYTGGTL